MAFPTNPCYHSSLLIEGGTVNNLKPIDTQQLKHVKNLVSNDNSTVSVFYDPANRRNIISKRSQRNNHFIKNEIDILEHVTHPNIVKYYGHVEINGYYRLFLNVMDLSLDKLLKDLLNKNNTLNDETNLYIAFSIARGLLYLHQNQIIHCDLKPDNILLNKACTDINICDFGFSVDLKNSPTPIKWTKGSPCWISPEVTIICSGLLQSPEQPEKIDIWGLGQILLQLYINTQGEPYHPDVWGPAYESHIVVMRAIRDGKLDTIPKDKPLSGVISWCLKKTPSERCDAAQVIDALEKLKPVPVAEAAEVTTSSDKMKI
jgi:serine/threonine protein kinase